MKEYAPTSMTIHMKSKSSIASNIWKLYFLQGAIWFFIVTAIIVLFYQENGLSMREIFIVQSVFSVVLLVMEVPSGYFSDRIGRKKALIIGALMLILGWSIYAISYSFYGFLIAEGILATGISFISGTDRALMYDTLLELNRKKENKLITGKMVSIGKFAEAIGMIIGGFLATISLRLPFQVQPFVHVFTLIIALSLVEPKVHKAQSDDTKNMWQIIKHVLHEQKELKWLVLVGALSMTAGITMFWFMQPYFEIIGIPLIMFGIIFAVFRLSTGLFALWADPIEKYLGRKISLILLIFLPAVAYFGLGWYQTIWALAFYFVFQFTWGFGELVLQDYINNIVTSDMRATVLSINSFMGRIFFALFGPLLGWINDIYTLQQALLVGGGIIGVSGIISLYFLHRHKIL